jgi:signal transduction histidine kinase
VLYEFLTTNRATLIDRCLSIGASRSGSATNEHPDAHGIPVFLDQLINTLRLEDQHEHKPQRRSGDAGALSDSELSDTARQHGRDLLEQGFTLEQVVRDYGDVCQAVTNLAFETAAPIAVDEFRTFNRCLDNAIAGAVTEFAKHSAKSREPIPDELSTRLGPLAHELRNYLHTAMLVVAAIKTGNVAISGATGGVLDRSLLGMRSLIDHALAEVRVTARMPPRLQVISLATLLGNVKLTAAFDALARGTPFTVDAIAENILINVDPEMLAASIVNLLQNAFKFTKHQTQVRLYAHATADRVLIEVEDRCGGLPEGYTDKVFRPFSQSGENRSGLGLGLDIARRGVAANEGVLRVRDLPGTGCIFTIDLPLHLPALSPAH